MNRSTQRLSAREKCSMTGTVRSWIKKAEADYRFAHKNLSNSQGFFDQLAFHFQQATEKYLKALMEHRGVSVAKTHNLHDLINALLPNDPNLKRYRRGMRFLTRFAVATRYPGDGVNKRQLMASFRWATKVRAEVRT